MNRLEGSEQTYNFIVGDAVYKSNTYVSASFGQLLADILSHSMRGRCILGVIGA